MRRNRAVEAIDNAKEHLEGGGGADSDFRDDQTGDTGGSQAAAPKKRGRPRKAKFASTNGYDPEKLGSYVGRIFNLKDELASVSGTLRRDMKEVYQEAADQAGIPTKLLKRLVKEEDDRRKKEAWLEELEADERQSLEQLEAALGAFKETELGQAAMARAAE